ncbi:MAG: anaerobic ribonucleoside-triphosphate reductase activating protein [Candidatus Falkowbacteria bacterium]
MIIGGLQKFSMLDYPEYLSAIIFTQGCNFRCQFCYNPMLVEPLLKIGETKNIEKGFSLIKENDLFRFLKERVGKLDGVVITGGEPTIHNDLEDFIKKIKDLNYLVKLDTNGTNSEVIEKLINKKLIDYIAMDVKAGENNYEKVIVKKIDFTKIKKSVKIIKESGLNHEFRTTVIPGLVDKNEIEKIGKLIKGAEKWYLQNFKSDVDLINKKLENINSFTDKEMLEMKKIGKKYVSICEIR